MGCGEVKVPSREGGLSLDGKNSHCHDEGTAEGLKTYWGKRPDNSSSTKLPQELKPDA